MMKLLLYLFGLLLILSFKGIRPPNIVYILADDLGIGDVSAYNPNGKIYTKHIDQLASNGMRFTDAHAGSAVCTPTRYGIITGRYSWRGMLKKGVTWSYDKSIIEDGRLTVGQLMKQKGYTTGCIGKWHLGLNWADSTGKWPVDFDKKVAKSPNSFGFDYSFIIPASLDIPPYVYVENEQLTALPDRNTIRETAFGWWRYGPTGRDFKHEEVLPTFAEKAVQFIEKNRDKPFFLYLPLAAPHTPILPDSHFQGKSGVGEYGDFVLMVDAVVGRVTTALEENGLADNTLIIFTSDNGCAPYAGTSDLEKKGHFPSLNYRGYKADIYEGGHRVPFIAKWKNKIQKGTISNETICLTDLMATLADITAYNLPQNAAEDSFSLMPIFQGRSSGFQRKYTIHHSVFGAFAIRKENWKLIMAPGSAGWSDPKPGKELKTDPEFQLFDLDIDPNESKNLIDEYPSKLKSLKSQLIECIKNGRSNKGPRQDYLMVNEWPGLAWMEE